MNPFEFTGDGPSSLTLGLIGIACLAIYDAPRFVRSKLTPRRRRRIMLAIMQRRGVLHRSAMRHA